MALFLRNIFHNDKSFKFITFLRFPTVFSTAAATARSWNVNRIVRTRGYIEVHNSNAVMTEHGKSVLLEWFGAMIVNIAIGNWEKGKKKNTFPIVASLVSFCLTCQYFTIWKSSQFVIFGMRIICFFLSLLYGWPNVHGVWWEMTRLKTYWAVEWLRNRFSI